MTLSRARARAAPHAQSSVSKRSARAGARRNGSSSSSAMAAEPPEPAAAAGRSSAHAAASGAHTSAMHSTESDSACQAREERRPGSSNGCIAMA
jgi:hypothetical protein